MVLPLLLPYLLFLLHVVLQVVQPVPLAVPQVLQTVSLAVPQVDQPAHHAELPVVHLAKKTHNAARFPVMYAVL